MHFNEKDYVDDRIGNSIQAIFFYIHEFYEDNKDKFTEKEFENLMLAQRELFTLNDYIKEKLK